MDLYLKSNCSRYNAIAEYNVEKKEFVVKKGSTLSKNVAFSDKFKSATKIVERRKNTHDESMKLIKDILFKSPSTAANFVTGRSTNGLIAWKNADNKKLKDLL